MLFRGYQQRASFLIIELFMHAFHSTKRRKENFYESLDASCATVASSPVVPSSSSSSSSSLAFGKTRSATFDGGGSDGIVPHAVVKDGVAGNPRLIRFLETNELVISIFYYFA